MYLALFYLNFRFYLKKKIQFKATLFILVLKKLLFNIYILFNLILVNENNWKPIT